MAYFVTQVFTPKDKWLKLNRLLKEQVLQRMIINLSGLAGENRVQLIAMGEIDENMPRAVAEKYFINWSIPGDEATKALISHLRDSEWNEYFEVINIGGKGLTVPEYASTIIRVLNEEEQQ
ncbi:MAG: DUF6616 family protein [Commensalibacter sp.]